MTSRRPGVVRGECGVRFLSAPHAPCLPRVSPSAMRTKTKIRKKRGEGKEDNGEKGTKDEGNNDEDGGRKRRRRRRRRKRRRNYRRKNGKDEGRKDEDDRHGDEEIERRAWACQQGGVNQPGEGNRVPSDSQLAGVNKRRLTRSGAPQWLSGPSLRRSINAMKRIKGEGSHGNTGQREKRQNRGKTKTKKTRKK